MEYIDRLDRVRGVALLVWFETSRDDVINYALVLVAYPTWLLASPRRSTSRSPSSSSGPTSAPAS